MTKKRIRWFEASLGIPAAFHNTTGRPVVCLNYKNYDNLREGFDPWFLCNPTYSLVTLINEWGGESERAQLERGAQAMVIHAAENTDFGFKDGDFYGIFWIGDEYTFLGLAYSSLDNVLTPVKGLIERYQNETSTFRWVTHQCQIPLVVEVNLGTHGPIRRISRYDRDFVI